MTILPKKTIVVPFDKQKYSKTVQDTKAFRAELDRIYKDHPQIFPAEFANGYRMKDTRISKKLSIRIRRIKINGTCYSIRPSFVMPYMTALTEDVEKALFLRKHNVPYWAIAQVHGRYPMYWYRIEQQLGRNSIVGTTVQKKNCCLNILLPMRSIVE
jgi:hypothetical protein